LSSRSERAEDLFAQRATEGLSPAERCELRERSASYHDIEPSEHELAAAAIQLAVAPRERMPSKIREEIRRRSLERAHPARSRSRSLRIRQRRSSWMRVAAVAALVATGLLIFQLNPDDSLPAQRQGLIASAEDLVRMDWTATEDPAANGVSGNVVWSPGSQSGFMLFEGLAPNDPAVSQYQLWIFDGTRSQEQPVDGGTFDVPVASNQIVIRIDAKLPVREAALFAVTVEQPGGVVVSDRERVVALAGL
jgi:anti-sigma-K factor RskA